MRTRRLILAMIGAALMVPCLGIPSFGGQTTQQAVEPTVQTREKFTLVVLTDTQTAPAAQFNSMTQWIADNVDSENIRFVVQVGDLVEWPRNSADWTRARAATDRLDGKVPYAIAIGNHDFDNWYCSPPATCDPNPYVRANHATTLFNGYYPLRKFSGLPSFGGNHPANSNDNSYHMFNAGGTDWLVLTLKWPPCPRAISPCTTADADWQARLAWAEQVISSHPGHQVIINTHEYLGGGARRSVAGDDLWLRIKKYANVQFVLSGHFRGYARAQDLNDHGQKVFQILQDYSTYSNDAEDSYFRIMTFDPASGSVKVETYSAYCQQNPSVGCPAYKTGDAHSFTLQDVRFPQSASSHQLSRGSTTSATATSAHSGYEASKALDGNSQTFWHTPYKADGTPSVSLPQSVALDLGRTRATTGLRYGPRQGPTAEDKNGIVTGYNAYVSTNGTAFTKVASGTWAFDPNPKAASWTSTPARYVKFEATATGSALGWASAGELNVAFDPEPLAPRSSASATSSFAQNPAGAAIDSSMATMWHTNYNASSGAPIDQLPQSLTIDLGSSRPTTGLYYTPRQDPSSNGRITAYNVHLSTDGTTYTKITSGTWANSRASKAASWAPTLARYVRLEATDSVPYNGYRWAAAAEVEVAHSS